MRLSGQYTTFAKKVQNLQISGISRFRVDLGSIFDPRSAITKLHSASLSQLLCKFKQISVEVAFPEFRQFLYKLQSFLKKIGQNAPEATRSLIHVYIHARALLYYNGIFLTKLKICLRSFSCKKKNQKEHIIIKKRTNMRPKGAYWSYFKINYARAKRVLL